jgi:D-methionine transport system substrate-binding protein
MKRKFGIILTFALLVGALLASCSGGEKKVVKVGVNGSGVPTWEYIKEKAADEGIEIELVEFADYVRPNMALADGDIDINSFQTISYFNSFIEEKDLDLSPIGTTYIAPMGLYSEKYKSADEIPEGSTIAVPQEATNMGRALLLLQEAGLIELEEGFDGNGDLEAITKNPKNIKFEAVVAAQTPRVLPDVAGSVINNGVAVEAGFIPVEDSIFREGDTATPYINIIAARTEDKDNETYKKIVEIFQTDDVADHVNKVYKKSLIPTFVPLSEIGE